MVKKWAKDGTILDLETKYHIKHSKFAEDAHQKASVSSESTYIPTAPKVNSRHRSISLKRPEIRGHPRVNL